MPSSQAIRAGAAYIELYTKDSRLVRGLASASKRLKAFGASVQSLGLKTVALGSAMLAPFIAAVKHFADAGDQLNKMSQRTGVSVESLSELGYAAEQSGANLETLEGGLRKMQKTLVDAAQGSKSANETLHTLGLSIKDLVSLSPDQQFKLLADRLARIQDPTLRAAMAMEVFGKSGTQLLPLMADGARGIEQLQQQARDLGLTIRKEDAEAATLLGDTFDDLWKTVKAGVFAIGSALAPLLTDLAKQATHVVVSVVGWIKQNKTLIVTVFKIAAAVIAVGAGLVVVGGLIVGFGAVLGSIATVITTVGAGIAILIKILTLLVSPIGLVIAAVTALAAYLLYATDVGQQALGWLAGRFEQLRSDATAAWQGIADALAAGDISLAAKILWLTLKMEWKRGIHFLNGLWIKFKDFFISTARGAVFGTAKILNDGWVAVEIGWIETVAFLADAWSLFTNMITKTWHASIGFIKKAWVRLKALFDEDIDVDAEVNRINRDVSDATSAADQQMLDAVGKRDEERRAQRAQIERDRAGTEDTLSLMQREEEAQRQKQFAEDLAGTEEELAAARREWQDAIGDAAKKRAAAQGNASNPERLKKIQDGLLASGGVLADQQQKISSKGTFNAIAVRGMGADSLAERTAKATEQIVLNTKELVDRAKQGKLAFS